MFLVLLIYVDDLVLAANNHGHCHQFKSYLRHCFKFKDLGPLKYFLCIEIAHSQGGLFLCEFKYVLDILIETGMMGAKPSTFPRTTITSYLGMLEIHWLMRHNIGDSLAVSFILLPLDQVLCIRFTSLASSWSTRVKNIGKQLYRFCST